MNSTTENTVSITKPALTKPATSIDGIVAPIVGNVTPIAENVTSIAGKVTPIAENVTSIAGKVTPIAENVTSIAGKVTPRAEIKKLFASKDLFIFDLDGTLFNTLGDLAPAVNYALKHFGIAEISMENVRSCIGNGSRNLIRRAVASGIMYGAGKTAGEPIEGKSGAEHLDVRDKEVVAAVLESAGFDDAKIDEVHKVYSAYYWEHCTENTVPYEGVIEIIRRINDTGKIAAMLTNKPVNPAKKILEKFGLIGGTAKGDSADKSDSTEESRHANLISAYLCGDTTPERKPSPAGIFAILKATGVAPEKAVMIGDDMPDVLAAKNAGIDSIALLKGFGRPENLLPLEPKWTAGHIKDLT